MEFIPENPPGKGGFSGVIACGEVDPFLRRTLSAHADARKILEEHPLPHLTLRQVSFRLPVVTPQDALRQAVLSGRLRRFEVSGHAFLRMTQRNVTREDIASALRSARSAAAEPNERWKLSGGTDLDGDALDVVVVFEAETIVVTVF